MVGSSFRSAARTIIRIADLKKKETIKMPSGTVTLKIEVSVKILENFKGFLTVGVEKRGTMIWNRRFCSLDGRQLKQWNYPQEEEGKRNIMSSRNTNHIPPVVAEVPPLNTINLENCATRLVDVADRSQCSRPRTLLLETYEESGIYKTIYKHFLAADTSNEMKMWRERINAVVLSLRSWGESRSQEFFSKCSEI